jgi:MFS family permease
MRERLPAELRALVGVGFVVALGYGIAAPAIPSLARSFDVGVTAASAVISVFAAVRIAFAPLSARLAGWLGELRTFGAGLLILALSSAACAVAGSFSQLLAFRAVGGVGSTLFTVSAAALVIRVAPPRMRGRATGAWATGFLLGTTTGPVIGGALAASSLRAPFLVYAALLVAASALAGGLLRGRVHPRRPDRPAATVVTFRSALAHATFRAALAANVVNGWTVHGVRIALVPLFVTEVLQRSSTWAGIALTAFAIGTAATLPIGGRWSDHRGRRPPVLVGSAVVAATAVGLGLSTTVAGLVAAALLGGAGTGLLSAPVNAAVGDVIAARGRDADGGAALAGFQMVGDLGAVVGPVLAATVVERTGYVGAFATVTAVAAMAFVGWLRAPETMQGSDRKDVGR